MPQKGKLIARRTIDQLAAQSGFKRQTVITALRKLAAWTGDYADPFLCKVKDGEYELRPLLPGKFLMCWRSNFDLLPEDKLDCLLQTLSTWGRRGNYQIRLYGRSGSTYPSWEKSCTIIAGQGAREGSVLRRKARLKQIKVELLAEGFLERVESSSQILQVKFSEPPPNYAAWKEGRLSSAPSPITPDNRRASADDNRRIVPTITDRPPKPHQDPVLVEQDPKGTTNVVEAASISLVQLPPELHQWKAAFLASCEYEGGWGIRDIIRHINFSCRKLNRDSSPS